MQELILGAGSRHDVKILFESGHGPEYKNPTTLDINPAHNPDVVFDLRQIRTAGLPFEANSFDEIHAYEVLEHLAMQGDEEFFFAEWNEYYRVLKPGGKFFGTVPAFGSPWMWGDPSHKRVILQENFVFLSQEAYEEQVGKTTMSDFRYLYHGDFKLEFTTDPAENPHNFGFCLRSLKPEISVS